jgi:hypothetical protein
VAKRERAVYLVDNVDDLNPERIAGRLRKDTTITMDDDRCVLDQTVYRRSWPTSFIVKHSVPS